MKSKRSMAFTEDDTVWLKVMAYVHFQQNRFTQARRLLDFLSDNFDFDFSVRIQLILTLTHLNMSQNATKLLRDTLNNSITNDQKYIVERLLQQLEHLDT